MSQPEMQSQQPEIQSQQSELSSSNKKKGQSQHIEKISKYLTQSKQKLALSLAMEGLLKQARTSLECYLSPKLIPVEQKFSRDMLIGAQGILFITEVKASFMFGGSGGSGIMLCRQQNGNWSGPCAVSMGSISWGFSAGVSKVDHIVILPTSHHVRTFIANDSLQISANIGGCVANVGRNANIGYGISQNATSPVVSYSFSSKGLYGGIDIEGTIITVRHACNEEFYKIKISLEDIISGNIPMPQTNEDYQKIICLLNSYCGISSSTFQVNNNTNVNTTTTTTTNNNNNNDNNNDNNNNNVNTNAITSIPLNEEPIIREKPQLLRQNAISPNFAAEQMNTDTKI